MLNVTKDLFNRNGNYKSYDFYSYLITNTNFQWNMQSSSSGNLTLNTRTINHDTK